MEEGSNYNICYYMTLLVYFFFNVYLAIVSGQIIRNTKSSDHMKVKDVIVSSRFNELNLQAHDIIRLAKRSEEPLRLLRRNRQFTLRLKRTSNRDYTVMDILPSVQDHTAAAGIIC